MTGIYLRVRTVEAGMARGAFFFILNRPTYISNALKLVWQYSFFSMPYFTDSQRCIMLRC